MSISLLRANVALTSNIKLVVDTKYNLYLESYNSNRYLNDKKYKKFLINSESFLSERFAKFYDGLPIDIAFDIKNEILSNTAQNDYGNQYDDIYYSGPRNVEDKRYDEEFQYNTTLKINPDKLPKYFFIFRKDDVGLETNVEEYISDLKCITFFDLTPKTNIGKLWLKNYINDDEIPTAPFELNLNEFEFSQWNGYDYFSGGTVSKSVFIDDTIRNQLTDFELEKHLTEGFRKNEVICSNYLNVSYLFDDTVGGIFIKSTSSNVVKYYEDEFPFIYNLIRLNKINHLQYNKDIDSSGNVYYTFNEYITYRRKWTINRYSGFYVNDMKLVSKLSTYINAQFINDIELIIKDNVFGKIINDQFISVSPLVGVYVDTIPIHFKIKDEYYLVEKINNKFIIVSDIVFNGKVNDFLSEAIPTIKIEYLSINNVYNSYIKNIDDSYYYNKLFDNYISGIPVIKIFDKFYKLNIDTINKLVSINSDELIIANSNIMERTLAGEKTIYNNLQILTKDNVIDYFEIYFLKFTDVKDFDFNRTNTTHSKYEYERNNVVDYARPAFYKNDISDVALPIDLFYEKNYQISLFNTTTQITTPLYTTNFLLPLSSEYAANDDLYVIKNNGELSEIWDINQSVNKFVLTNSINTNACGYKLNNSIIHWGVTNKTPNMYAINVSIQDLNLDWFYSIGRPINYDLNNYSTLNLFNDYIDTNIIHRTLNIDVINLVRPFKNDMLDNNIKFYYKPDFNYYKDVNSFNYFTYIFNLPYIRDKQEKYTKQILLDRIAILTKSDKVNGPSVFFNGFHAYLQYVKLQNPNIVDNFSTTPADDLNDYEFSIVFTSKETTDITKHGKAGYEVILNKIHKNILINLYINVPFGSYTSVDFRERSKLYNEKTIKYTIYDTTTQSNVFIDSELSTQNLTLSNFINNIISNNLTPPGFSDGVKYTIIDNPANTIKYKINSTSIDTINNTLTIKFDKNIDLKENDWVKFYNINHIEFNENIQIIEKINNLTYTFKFTTDITILETIINNNLLLIYATHELSILPFRFKIILPNETGININKNILVPDTTSAVIANNNNISINHLLVNIDNIGLIPHVYTSDIISRRKFTSLEEIDLSDIIKLPKIKRFSGYYEPALNNIELFNKDSLMIYNTALSGTTVPSTYIRKLDIILDTTTGLLNCIVYLNNFNSALNTLQIGDIFYINNAIDYPFLHNKTGHVLNVETTISGSLKVTLYMQLNPSSVTITGLTDIYDTGKMADIYFMKYIESNLLFNYNLENFGMNKNIIIAKNYDTTNPMRSNNNINNRSNIYPMIDEHGVTVIDRNIFQSNWDKKYFYKIINNKYKTI